jgi:HEAT repeat protein
MISKMNQEPRGLYISSSTLSFACLALLTVSTSVAQDRIPAAGQSNSNSTKKTHVATLHSTDSSEGSRVAITSDQSLNEYEAYRRGDRFYVKIPAADVSRAESARGRGFADVKSQRNGDSTVLSSRLQPGASARIEQRGNKLDVVVSLPGGSPATTAADRPRDLARPATSESSRTGDLNKRGTPKSNNSSAGANNSLFAKSASGNANESWQRGSADSSPANSNSAVSSVTAPANATPEPAPQSQASSGTQTTSSTPVPQSSSLTNTSASPSPAMLGTAHENSWTRAKERGHYWLLLAQLNPIPVGIGAMLLVFIIMLLFLQRRRPRSKRRIKAATSTAAAAAEGAASSKGTKTAIRAAAATVVARRPSVVTESLPVTPASQPAATVRAATATPTVVSGAEVSRPERVSRASEEAKKFLAGDQYDERFIGSEDPNTRRLVGAELLSALVSRNTERRERARAAFMKHGYFDDATRDLRIADSENERAAAARRLSFVKDREATPHLIGALNDPSPDVRRAVVEALMDVRDPAAIAALNALLQNEKDRKVPRHLIQSAIEACAVSPETEAIPEPDKSPAPPPASFNADREVIEI